MLKIGLISLAIAAGCLVLFFLLTGLGIVGFGSCGPYGAVSILLMLGAYLCGGVGLLLPLAALIERGVRRLRQRGD